MGCAAKKGCKQRQPRPSAQKENRESEPNFDPAAGSAAGDAAGDGACSFATGSPPADRYLPAPWKCISANVMAACLHLAALVLHRIHVGPLRSHHGATIGPHGFGCAAADSCRKPYHARGMLGRRDPCGFYLVCIEVVARGVYSTRSFPIP